MKNILGPILCICLIACENVELIPKSYYTCKLSFPDEGENHPKHAAFQSALEKVGKNTPGVQVAVRTSDGKLWTGAVGRADIPQSIPLLPCNKIMVGSISKVFTAVMILQLQDEGILRIDDPLTNWLDDALIKEIQNADKVDLEQLLNHTSGIRDYLGTEQFINSLNTENFKESQAEKLSYVYGEKAYHEPGQQFTYSNTNYVLLGLVVEKARNMPLWDAVEAFIAQPLGLQELEMGTHDLPIPKGTARPYLLYGNNRYYDILELAVSDAATGDGGIASNMVELVISMEGLFSGKLISPQSLTQMTESLVQVGAEADFPQWENEAYGLGISRFNTPYGTAYGHTGSTSSYNAYLFYFPEKKISVSYAYNGSADSRLWERRKEFRQRLFEIAFAE